MGRGIKNYFEKHSNTIHVILSWSDAFWGAIVFL